MLLIHLDFVPRVSLSPAPGDEKKERVWELPHVPHVHSAGSSNPRVWFRVRVRVGLRVKVRVGLRVKVRVGLRVQVRVGLRVQVRVGVLFGITFLESN